MDVHIATDSGAGRRVQCVPLTIPTGFPPISDPPRELHTGMASYDETTRQDASLSSRPKLPHTPHLGGSASGTASRCPAAYPDRTDLPPQAAARLASCRRRSRRPGTVRKRDHRASQGKQPHASFRIRSIVTTGAAGEVQPHHDPADNRRNHRQGRHFACIHGHGRVLPGSLSDTMNRPDMPPAFKCPEHRIRQ